MSSVVDHIGNTPLVRLTRVAAGHVRPEVEVWAKLEWFNPGGSVKDRAAWGIIRDAEERGLIKPRMRLLDSSSGNTGIAYGMICAARGHELTLCMPSNANRERKKMLQAYGVEVILTDPLLGSDGAIQRARALVAKHPDRYLYLDQYSNNANWLAHEAGTAQEIWHQTEGRLTHWVAALGTTGTFVGTARGLRRHNPHIACISLQPDSPFHGLEGWKHLESAIVPPIYDESVVDANVGVPTEAALALIPRLAREEGLLVGPSGAGAVWGALEVASKLDHGVVVTLIADSGQRYLSEVHLWG